MTLSKITNSIYFLAVTLFFISCDKTETASPPIQNLSLTDYETITDNLVIEEGTKVAGAIDTTVSDKTVSLLSTQELKPTYPGGNIEINVSYSYKDTLDRFRFEVIGADKHWPAPVVSTQLVDTLLTGLILFKTPNNLAPGKLKFRYQLYKTDSIKTNFYDSEIEILQFPNSGGTINI